MCTDYTFIFQDIVLADKAEQIMQCPGLSEVIWYGHCRMGLAWRRGCTVEYLWCALMFKSGSAGAAHL